MEQSTNLVKKAALEAADTCSTYASSSRRQAARSLAGFIRGKAAWILKLVVWIRPESVKRPGTVNADYNWALEKALTKYGIEIPFPSTGPSYSEWRVTDQAHGQFNLQKPMTLPKIMNPKRAPR